MIYVKNGKIVQVNGFDGEMSSPEYADERHDALGTTSKRVAKKRAAEKAKRDAAKAQAVKVAKEKAVKAAQEAKAKKEAVAARAKKAASVKRAQNEKRAKLHLEMQKRSSRSLEGSPQDGEAWDTTGTVYMPQSSHMGELGYLGTPPDEFLEPVVYVGTSTYNQGENNGMGLFGIKKPRISIPNPVKAVASVAKVAMAPVAIAAKTTAKVGGAVVQKTPLKVIDKATGGIASSAVNVAALTGKASSGEKITRAEAIKGAGDLAKVAAVAAGGGALTSIAQQTAAKQLTDVAARSKLTRDSAIAQTAAKVGSAAITGGGGIASAAQTVAQQKAAEIVVKKAEQAGLTKGIVGQLAVGTATGAISKGSLDLVSAAEDAAKKQAQAKAREVLAQSPVGQKVLQAEAAYNKVEAARANIEKASNFLATDPAAKVQKAIEQIKGVPSPAVIVQKIESDKVKAVASAIHQTDVAKAATKELVKVQAELVKEIDKKIDESKAKLESKMTAPETRAQLVAEVKNLVTTRQVHAAVLSDAKKTETELAATAQELKVTKEKATEEAKQNIAEVQKTGQLPKSYDFDHPLLVRKNQTVVGGVRG